MPGTPNTQPKQFSYGHPAGFWMIDQNSISVVVQGSIFFGCALVMIHISNENSSQSDSEHIH